MVVQAIKVDEIQIDRFLASGTTVAPPILVRDMEQNGQKNPIEVQRYDKIVGKKYRVLHGFLRLDSAIKLGWSEIQATVYDMTDEQVKDFVRIVSKDKRVERK